MSTGIKIGHYEMISTIGRGSIGVVYKARDTRLGRIVAVKALKSIFLEDLSPENLELKRFYQESKAAAQLRHSNIVTIFDVGCTELGSPYIVMDYIEGSTLSEIIDSRKTLTPEKILSYLLPISDAVDYAHSNGVLHRDITPNNIIIDKSGKPFLLDFSLAKMLNHSITPTGTLLGSPGYMAPELIDGGVPTKASDIFSLGVLAYEMFTGEQPFRGEDIVRIVFSVINEPPITFSELGVDLPYELENVIARAIAKNPRHRYESAKDFADEVEKVFSSSKQEVVSSNDDFALGVTEKFEQPPASNPRWGEFREIDPGRFSFRNERFLEDRDIVSHNSLLKMMVMLVVITLVLIIGLIAYRTPEVRAIFAKLKNSISSAATSETGLNELKTEPFNQGRYIAASDKKLKALLEKGTSVNGQGDVDTVRSAIFAAATREDKKFTQLLKDLSNHPDQLIRVEALRALSSPIHFVRDGIQDTFLAKLNDQDYLVRGFAIKALADFGDASVANKLKQRHQLEQNQLVREVLEQAIAKIDARHRR